MSYLTVVSTLGRHCGHTTQLTTVLISICKFFVCCFWFPPRFTLGFYFAYVCSSSTCEKKCHILIGCLFVNLRLTHKPCLGAINLHAFKYKWTKNHLLLLAVVKSGLLTIVKTGITIVSYFSNLTASLFALNIVRKFTPR